MITIYGIKNCDSCKKAFKHFCGKAEFRDVRNSPLSKETLKRFIHYFGDKLINTRSTTWKTLTPSQKSMNHLQLLSHFPTVMKRPVIECEKNRIKTIGWNIEVQNQYNPD